eukprot:CAMPEP_0179412114 /NCGR_PEP_ID=MMETSP0799-20121207/4280_1 /TAXON_ID=46947 /ORGANISM="Geminigera cryophila, Strain CCMP2564" /LENGTH=80 /DNA_ID=CAMNT_0021184273 /DNA_START=555 /DNA_END=797 /DNA_ORIENTATION=+
MPSVVLGMLSKRYMSPSAEAFAEQSILRPIQSMALYPDMSPEEYNIPVVCTRPMICCVNVTHCPEVAPGTSRLLRAMFCT